MRRNPPLAPRLLIGLLLSAALGAGAPGALAADTKEKAAKFYEDALLRFEHKDIPGTIVQLKNALQADKTLLPVQVLLGRALMMDGQAVAAEVAITEALRLGVDRAELVVTLGQALLAQGKPQQVLEQARMAPAGLPNGVRLQVLLMRASAQADLGDPAAALKSVEEARAIDRNAPETWLAEVPIRLRSQQFKEAVAAADAALKLAPDSAEAHYQRATIAHARAEIGPAIEGYGKALSLNPNHGESRISRAGLYLDQRRDAEAQADLDEARKRSPRDPRAAYLRALLAERKNDRAGAKAALGQVVALLDPVPIEFIRYRPQLLLLNGLAHYGLDEPGKAKPFLEAFWRSQPATPVAKVLAQLYLQENNADKAIDVLETYLRAFPGDGRALTQLAAAHMARGRPGKASALMQEALKSKESPEFRTALGMALIQSGDGTAARKELAAAFQKDPSQVQAGLSLVALSLRQGQSAEAVAIAEQLLKRQPNNPVFLNIAGVAKAESHDYDGARKAFEAALAQDKAAVAPQLGLARLDIATQAYDKAMTRLKALLKADDHNTEVLYDMAVLQDRLGKPEEAQRNLERAAELAQKTDLRPNFALVEFHLRRNRPAPALEAAKLLLAKAPDDVAALEAYGRAQLASGDGAAARQSFVNASRRAGFDADRQAEIAGLQLAEGDLDNASYSLEKALSSQADHLGANVLMARVEMRRKDLAKAETRAKRIVQLYPRLAVGHQLLGDIAGAKGQSAAAAEAYRTAHKAQPSTATALALLRLLSAQGQAAEAKSMGDGWVKAHPQDVAVRRALADHFARNGDFGRARSEYEAVLKIQPSDGEALNNLANVQLLLKDTKAAVSTAELALALAPANPEVIDTLGWALFQDGRTDAALLKLRDARLRSPSNPGIRYHLAAVLAKVGKSAEAREELTTALRDHPKFAEQSAAKALLDTLK